MKIIKPVLDLEFKPAVIELREFNKEVLESGHSNRLIISIKRNKGYIYSREFLIFEDGYNDERNIFIIERFIKTVLWICGGYEIYIAGSKKVYEAIKEAYSPTGSRAFDYDFMSTVYETNVKVIESTIEDIPHEISAEFSIGGHLEGKRIGFDAGGSDRKVSAVVDGKVIYSEEKVWLPKLNEDPNYQFDGIFDSFYTAYQKMGDVDAIGVSTAGVIIDNKPMVSSLFIKVDKNKHFEFIKQIYINAAKKLESIVGHQIPIEVANDGDVTALAGSIDLKDGGILGIAMGTSEAAGYVNEDGNLLGWISELAFAPIDFNKDAMIDEWSGDYGVGCKYLSQDAVIKLAKKANIEIDESLTLAEKLKYIQKLNEEGNELANQIFESIGVYLAYAVAYYAEFYKIKHVLILGRVTSGKGGDTILKVAQETLHKQFKEYQNIDFSMPSEYMRRVGQSIAAASLAKK